LRKSLHSDKRLDYPLVFCGFNDDPKSALQLAIRKIISEEEKGLDIYTVQNQETQTEIKIELLIRRIQFLVSEMINIKK
jgi:hypothetical protein